MPSVFNTNKGRRVDQQRTICEVQRQAWDLIVEALQDRPHSLARIRPVMEEAALLGIKLIKHMIDHKIELPEWEMNNVEEAKVLRAERVRLEKLLAMRNPLS